LPAAGGVYFQKPQKLAGTGVRWRRTNTSLFLLLVTDAYADDRVWTKRLPRLSSINVTVNTNAKKMDTYTMPNSGDVEKACKSTIHYSENFITPILRQFFKDTSRISEKLAQRQEVLHLFTSAEM
jgi:hypothetical protein